ncbi:DUF1003 domain-containing protein [Sphingomonas sp.]|uniref:DUF1003 domain-containing protein n=1 Tax=Sphingomonas sp. TaxID=28214 RepID=UPI0037523252
MATTPATAADLASQLLAQSGSDLGIEERRVLHNIAVGNITSRDAADVADAEATFGERLSDKVAAVGGSWGFIVAFSAVLVAWMVLNTEILGHLGKAFDPYPYIFLNLLLSTVAAIQAPVIMMSQNRQASKDRLAARLDYETNLRAELDILRLHQKIDSILAGRIDALGEKLDVIEQEIREGD